MIPAIMCGNTCGVLRLSLVCWPHQHAAGLPDGVINFVHGKGSGAGQYLVDAVDEGLVNKISFTGSTGVGKMIGEVCGRNLVSCSLELGGKNPLVVMPSADINNAVEGAYSVLLVRLDNITALATSSFTKASTTNSWRNSWPRSSQPASATRWSTRTCSWTHAFRKVL